MKESIDFTWLAPRAQKTIPVTFGAPWAREAVRKGEALTMTSTDGTPIAVQTKNTAFWPDGSVKWTAHSAVLKADTACTISKGALADPATGCGITATQDADGAVTVESSLLSCRVESGGKMITALSRGEMAPMAAELTALIETVQEAEDRTVTTVTRFTGNTEKVVVEEAGPVRVVVKLDGAHIRPGCGKGERATVFPFCVRLYFYAGSDEVKIVHSFVFDLDEDAEFLKGIAVAFEGSASGDAFNRHIGFTGEAGMFYEGVQGMYNGNGPRPEADGNKPEGLRLYERQQLEGQFVALDRHGEELRNYAEIVDDNAAWNDFRLSQDSCDHYGVSKRTTDGCAYISAAQGNRAGGTAFFGSEAGIYGLAIKDFWQKCPTALEINGARGDRPVMTAWLYSRYAEAYDFRAYDKVSHKHSYGGVHNVPDGIANTSEVHLKLFENMPGKQAVIDFSNDVQSDSLLIADPSVYEETGVFGTYWSPPSAGAIPWAVIFRRTRDTPTFGWGPTGHRL